MVERNAASRTNTVPRVVSLPKRPIDMLHLRKQTLGDPGLQEEVLRMFDDMSQVYFGRIEHSTSVADLTRHLHTLKGAAAGIGAFPLSELARVAEEELRRGEPVNPERIEDLDVAVQQVSAFIGSLYKHHAA